MTGRRFFLVVLSLTLAVVGLFGVPSRGDAQKASLPESYVWTAYGIGVYYPDDWTVAEEQTLVSIHPADRDISDGQGPEFVLFALSNTADLDAAAQQYVNSVVGATDPVIETTLAGNPARSFTFNQTEPDTMGRLMLASVDNNTVLGAAYIVRDSEAETYLDTLRAMFDTLDFSDTAETVEFISRDVASVQLPQRYDWSAAGLTFYYPVDWDVTLSDDTVRLRSHDATNDMLIRGMILDIGPSIDLHEAVSLLAQDLTIENTTELTVAGYPAVSYEITTQEDSFDIHMIGFVVDVQDQGVLATFMFGSDVSRWEAFRPLVYAFIGGIERTTGQLSSIDIGSALRSHTAAAPGTLTLQLRRQGGSTTYTSEEYGISVELPEGWETLTAGSDWDIALVSPEAMQQDSGAFITIRMIPTLGTMTLDDALDSVAEEVGGEVEPTTLAGQDARQIVFVESETNSVHHLVLVPYGTEGAMLYIQSNAPDAQSDEAVQGVLNSLTIDPVVPDEDAINAAWQSSLADEGKLIYGSPDAPVRMIELLDFSCGHCATYSKDVSRLAALESDESRLQIQWVIGDWIGRRAGEFSKNAMMATYCATEQGKGFTAYETLFGAYLAGGDPTEVYSREGMNELLGTDEIGLDLDALNACLDDGKYESALTEAEALWDQVGATGTPAVLFSINGGDPAFVATPEGGVWPGAIPISVIREKVQAAIDGETVTTTATPQ